jgi:hypothetical protein
MDYVIRTGEEEKGLFESESGGDSDRRAGKEEDGVRIRG